MADLTASRSITIVLQYAVNLFLVKEEILIVVRIHLIQLYPLTGYIIIQNGERKFKSNLKSEKVQYRKVYFLFSVLNSVAYRLLS